MKNVRQKAKTSGMISSAMAISFGIAGVLAAVIPDAVAEFRHVELVRHQNRKSTDPPMAPKGKLCQDLFLAIDHRDVAKVKELLSQGADPNSRNGLEFTPLSIASASHQIDVMKQLIAAGAKVDAGSTYGTPLTFACMTAHKEGADILIENGADVNFRRTDEMTPLMMACVSGRPDLVANLITRKAEVNARDVNGSTPLHFACRQGQAAVVKVLVDSGAKVEFADSLGETPLMAAAKNGNTACVKELLAKGADPNRSNIEGMTALTLAVTYSDDPALIQALLSAGANKSDTDSSGKSCGTIAVARGHSNVAKALGVSVPGRPAASRTPKQALEMSLSAVQKSMSTFHQRAACFSCHHEGLGRMATAALRDKGIAIDESIDRVHQAKIDGALGALKPLHEGALQNPEVMKQIPLIEINEVTPGDSWILAGMAAMHQPRTDANLAMAKVLARQQMETGQWSFSMQRVPMQSSEFTMTALAVRALATYGDPTENPERLKKAKKWLLETPAKLSEDRASRLLGLKWVSASAKELKPSVEAILADQRSDGGWSQTPGLQSDAYATGQALYALTEAGGVSTKSQAYKKGVEFLLRTQDSDGSWFVNKRAIPANNYFDANFPHAESQYSSFNATCWAMMALSRTLSNAGR